MNNKPKIKVSNRTLGLGKKFGTGNMTCKDSGGFDITKWVKRTGNVNMKKNKILTYVLTLKLKTC